MAINDRTTAKPGHKRYEELAEEIARQIAESHRFERRVISIACSMALTCVSAVAVAGLILTVQLLVAVCSNSALFAVLFTLKALGLRMTTLAPVLAFVSGVAVRTLQQSIFRPAWLLGTAVPIALACLHPGSLLSVSVHSHLWATALLRWTGLTLSCCLLTLLSRNYFHRGDPARS